MISDSGLYTLAIFLGSLAMILIVIYHFLEINSEDSTAVLEPVPSKEKSKGSEKTKGAERDLASKEAEPVRERSRDTRERRRG